MIPKKDLEKYYLKNKYSMQTIAKRLDCSLNKVKYWMNIYKIPIRSISEAIYVKHNPNGDPFNIRNVTIQEDSFLMGLGLGLYWGEGTKSNKYSIRLGNTDPFLILNFIKFLDRMYDIKKSELKFGLQIFNDTEPKKALNFWTKSLRVKLNQFQKVVITASRGLGVYRKKAKYGVVTLYYHNKKLRNIICGELKKIGFRD